MKRWFWGLLILLVLALASIYIFIPGKITVSNGSVVKCTLNKVNGCLRGMDRWAIWWPEHTAGKIEPDSFFTYHRFRYKLTRPLMNGADIELVKNQTIFPTNIFLLSLGKDSTAVEWRMSFMTSLNPIKRMLQYFEAVKIRDNMKAVLETLHNFAGKTENIYGISVRKEQVKYQYLMSGKKSFTHYPNTADIYEMIDEIRNYVTGQGAHEEDHPLLNIRVTDSLQYETEVAVPVDKKLPDAGHFSFKWMLKGGNILVSEIKGGPKTIEQSLQKFREYVTDHQFTVMAIPFQSLVTDRRQEADSSKWITWLYYPVM